MSEHEKEDVRPDTPEPANKTAKAAPAIPADETPGDAGDTAETAPPAAAAVESDGGRGRKRPGKQLPAGLAFVKATFNNTIVSITDVRGNVVSWSSAGRAGFKGSRKCTAFAATMVAQDAARQAIAKGMHEVEVRVQGAGAGRESAVRAIQSAGMNVSLIRDTTPIPHNGCRARKRRRV